MSRSANRGLFCGLIVCLFVLAGLNAVPTWGQQGTVGTVTITVVDPSGGVISGAQLELRDSATNDVRTGVTQDKGNYSFVGLSVGSYKLTVAKAGFESRVFDSVVVHAAQVTDLSIPLKVGVTSQTVEVHESEAPLVDTTSNAIGTTIDMKQIEDLPLGGRDLSGLANLVPGSANVPGTGPTWNGLPIMAQGNNIDGVISNTSRMKFSGNYAQPAVSARIEDMSEMTVQTDQMDLNQGFGQATMQINFVTRRGSNSFHGRAFEDFQNSYLNANSWVNDAFGSTKPHYEKNDFGGSIGGPILRNKLFFFGTYAESKQPGGIIATNRVLTSAAQSGVFTYTGTDNASHTVCLFTAGCPGGGSGIVDQYNAAHPGANYGANFPTSNAAIQQELTNINSNLSAGQLTGTSDPIIDGFQWQLGSPITNYYPAVRVDYNMSQNIRFNFAWNMTRYTQPNVNQPTFPGAPFNGQGTGNFTRFYTSAFGFDWTMKPTLVNQFRGGFLYYWQGFGTLGFNNIETQYPTVNWGIQSPEVPSFPYQGEMSGQQYSLPTPDYYPLFNASDTMTWQHASHTLSYGFSWYREQDHYWNAPAGYANYTMGLANGDPALNMFSASSVPAASGQNLSEIESLYAAMAGRVSNVGGQFAYNRQTKQYANTCCSAYNLDELSRSWGLFIQDSWRVKQNLTVNYGLRWDFTGDNHDLTNAYHTVPPSSLFGPSGIGNLFNPGSLKGNMNPEYVGNGHAYNPWNITPQPSIGIAWTPGFTDGLLGRLAGGGNTVIRAGFSLRDFIEPYQYYWDYATDQGSFYYQNFQLIAGQTGANPVGFFQPGSLSFAGGNALPATPIFTPSTTYQQTFPMAATTFTGFPAWGMDSNIKQPYTESWNFGIQRQLGRSNAVEIRYVGNRAVHQWIGLNINEVNIFGTNGNAPSFFNQFKQAQANLAINAANGNPGSFANNNLPGQAATPIFDAAFAGEVGAPFADYSNTQFVTWLQQGQAGAFGAALASPFGTTNYYCNLVGASFGPCATNLGYTGAGADYPINFFQANPYNEGGAANYLTAGGYSSYNALQVEFRQKQWHGMQFDVNYTWGHNLGLQTRNDWEGVIDNGYTLRNLRLSYAPTLYDLRHTINASGTYDLPFGAGKRFLNHGGILDRVVGGWTAGTIFTFQTGSPFALNGGFKTFNDYGDGGVVLNGVSRSQLQSAVGVYENGTVTPSILNPSFISSALSTGKIAPNTTPGTLMPPIWLHGPHFINDDLAITKFVPIRENLRFSLQGEFLNAFNHPNFAGNQVDNGVQDAGFGTVFGPVNALGPSQQFGRVIELRANLEF